MRTILWFRGHDLRLRDQSAVRAAAAADEMVPVFFLNAESLDRRTAAQRGHHAQFLREALSDLDTSLASRGSGLVLLEGTPASHLPELVDRWQIDRVDTLAAFDPSGTEQEVRLDERLPDIVHLHGGYTLHPPGSLRTGAGKPYSVFTPFSRAFRESVRVGAPESAPRALPPLPAEAAEASTPIPSAEDLRLTLNERIQRGGEQAARERLRRFLEVADDYADHRDRMDLEGTSRLSADLKFGTLSPAQVWTAVRDRLGRRKSAKVFQNELIWREFNVSTLHDRPRLLHEPFRENWNGFPWREDEAAWGAWVEGRTGYPVVDASARQLLAEGFVHNRARMISASFLTKHLLTDYTRGEAHYLEHLTDGDPAQNLAGWQWSAGCGCDAQPWFRIFNPVLQGRKFDPDGDYVRRWVPELRALGCPR